MRRVFVESNFILELAFRQEEYADCDRLIRAAESQEIVLVVPVYCLTEVFQTLGQRRQERMRAQDFLQEQIRQHLREQGAATDDIMRLGASLRELLIARTDTQTAALFAITAKLSQLAQVVAMPGEVLSEAQQAQQRHSLTPQDALVYASVCYGLKSAESAECLFISRNKEDFQKEALLAELRTWNCNYLSSFRAAVGRLGLNEK